MSTPPSGPPIYPFPRQPPPVPATEPAPKRSKSGRYAMPMDNGHWIEINDMEKMYARVTIERNFPDAEKLALEAWIKVENL